MSVLQTLAIVAALTTACSAETQQRPGRGVPSAVPAGDDLPLASGVVVVRGGETIELRGARIEVREVTYLNQPCPPDVQCFHSGVIRQVLFRVMRTGNPVLATVPERERKLVEGVELAVIAVREGPEADVQASLAVAPR